jgi:Kef-type K+ transport system membrane component KefB
MTPAELSVRFFLQMAVIIGVSRLVGWLAKRFLGQPQVVGEMIAGVLLGPSLLGLIAPDLQAALFPKDSRSVLFVGAQLGVGLYMFLVGLDFRSDLFRSQARSAVAVSISGMAAPFAVAALISPWLLAKGLFGHGVNGYQAFLFTGAAISITAFPMLARIIKERGLSGTPLGALSLSAGAIDDAGAWTVLAVVLATFGGGPAVAIKAIVGGGVFALFVLTLGPRLLAPLNIKAERDGGVRPGLLAIVLALFMMAAFAMDAVGIHAVFGGFILGCVMPRGRLARDVKAQLEPFTVIALLPIFFTYSGLNTRLDLVTSPELFIVTLVILAGSILAKGVACWAAARLTGQDNATAMGVGALMNARGLMELIIINIGLQKGIIGPGLFAMLVAMAIITTLLTSPLFELVYGRPSRAARVSQETEGE